MSIRYNADEVFAMAEQIERNGGAFYRKAAELASDAGTGAVLLELAGMEDEHLKTFAGMRTDLSAEERKSVVFDPDGQMGLYLRAMADQHVFNLKADPSALLSAGQAINDVLRIAIGLEKDSIVFYVGLKELVSERLGKDRLDGIIQEEFGHISTLSGKMT